MEFDFSGVIADLLRFGINAYNGMMKNAYSLFTTNPVNWEAGTGWDVVEKIYPTFVAVATTLIVIFFLVGFCGEAMRNNRKMNFDSVIMLLVKLVVSEGLVASSLTIVQSILSSVTALASLVGGNSAKSMKIQYNTAFKEYVEAFSQNTDLSNFGWQIMGLLLALVSMVVFLSCGGMIIYTAYMRMFKCLVVIPYAAFAFSTIAGGGAAIGHTFPGFIKYLLTVSLEVVTMIVALQLGVAIVNTETFKGLITLGENASYFLSYLNAIVTNSLSMLVVLGLIKGSEHITQRALALR